MAITSANKNKQTCPNKIQTEHPTLWHHLVLEMIEVNIFLRPEEAIFETGKSLSVNKIQVLFLRKYFNLHCIKQNEKHLYQIIHYVCRKQNVSAKQGVCKCSLMKKDNMDVKYIVYMHISAELKPTGLFVFTDMGGSFTNPLYTEGFMKPQGFAQTGGNLQSPLNVHKRAVQRLLRFCEAIRLHGSFTKGPRWRVSWNSCGGFMKPL